MSISTYGITLSVKKGSGDEEFAKLYAIKDFPDMIGEPNALETTTLDDSQQTFIPGIKQGETKSFTSNYTKADYKKGKELEGQELEYKLAFSDGSAFTFKGKHTMGLPGKGVDEVVEMTTNIMASSDVVFSDGAGMAALASEPNTRRAR